MPTELIVAKPLRYDVRGMLARGGLRWTVRSGVWTVPISFKLSQGASFLIGKPFRSSRKFARRNTFSPPSLSYGSAKQGSTRPHHRPIGRQLQVTALTTALKIRRELSFWDRSSVRPDRKRAPEGK